MSVPLLECLDVNKSYGGVQAVRDVSFTLGQGEIVGLIGPNGAGKTTFVDLICGVQAADSGEIRVLGQPLTGGPSRRANRGHLARTFQHPLVARDLTVRENILVGLVAHRLAGVWGITRAMFSGLCRSRIPAAGRVEEVCASLGIVGLDRECGQLTLGELRLVEVARALMQDPALLLLDEPFAGSDAHGIRALSDAILHVLERGCGVVLVDHNVDIVSSLVERIVLMQYGAVAFDGTTSDCLASPEMRTAYFGTRTLLEG